MSVPVIEVRIWGDRVGAVAPDPRAGCYVFAYDPRFVKKGVELAPRTMPLSAYRPPGFAFPELARQSFLGLPGLVADALPDDFGNALIDAWMAERGVAKNAITPLDRLAYMGKRGMGALEFRPAHGAQRESQLPLEMKSLVEAARRVVHGDVGSDKGARKTLSDIIRLGTSAGGARAKAVVAYNPTSQEIRSGQFDVPAGYEHWLLKFDGIGRDEELGTSADYGRIEYAYAEMAKAAGIEMAECRLLHENGRAHFMTRRFDRTHNEKHHVQTFSAMDHKDYRLRGAHAYAELFLCAHALGLGDAAMQQLFRRMAFNVMAKNCDDHTKNFSFLLRKGQNWALSPAYDVTHAYNPHGEWTYQHLMSVRGKFDKITRDDLLAEAERFSIPGAKRALSDVARALGMWDELCKEHGISERERVRVGKDFCV